MIERMYPIHTPEHARLSMLGARRDHRAGLITANMLAEVVRKCQKAIEAAPPRKRRPMFKA